MTDDQRAAQSDQCEKGLDSANRTIGLASEFPLLPTQLALTNVKKRDCKSVGIRPRRFNPGPVRRCSVSSGKPD
jgi:hypothetical protein